MRRLTPAALTMLMFGVVGLLVVAYVAKNLLARETPPPRETTRNIPMPIADIPAGTLITENHLGLGPYPLERLDRDMLLVNRVITGRVAKEEIKAAQPIRANQLYQPGELPSLSDRVGAGMRAVTVDVGNSGALVDGLVKPGEYVDVLFTYNANADSDQFQGGLTMRLFEGVKVVAFNRSLQQSRIDRSANHVTLELSQSQANIITLAKDRGVLTLTYNPSGAGNGGLALSSDERVTLYEILGLTPAEPDPEPFSSEIFRGAARDQLYFSERGRRLEGYIPPGRQGFNYRRYMGAPDAGSDRGAGPRMTLPPANRAPASGGAPSVQLPPNATPQLEMVPRRDPTALQRVPMNN